MLLLALTKTGASATDLSLSPLEVIHRNGVLNATDGKGLYTLKKNGRFTSSSGVMSGVMIVGKWKLVSGSKDLTVEVKGTWSMLNAISADEVRTVKLVIHPGILKDTGHTDSDVYQCALDFTPPR